MIHPLLTINALPFGMDAFWLLLVLIVLLIVSALISGSETAFFSLSPSHIKTLKNTKSESKISLQALSLLESQDYLLSTILIINNLVNIGAIMVANSFIDKIVSFGDSGVLQFVIKTIIVTFVLLLFGEIMPKIIAAYYPYMFARMMTAPLYISRKLLRPFSHILIKLGSGVTRTLSHKGVNVSIDEISDAIDITSESMEDKKMLRGIVRFVGTEVTEIMKPRVDVVAIDVREDFESIKVMIMESGHSRFPVYDDNFDNIKGVLYIKDIIPNLSESADFEWHKLLKEPFYVPENRKINDLLEDFQTRKVHMAIVVDEYGGTLGIVTLEDVLEEIVGEISDELDMDHPFYTKLDDYTYLFEGKTHIGDFARVVGVDNNHFAKIRSVADTLAGVMLELKGDFLKNGDKVMLDNITLIATKVDQYRILEIKVILKQNLLIDHDDQNN